MAREHLTLEERLRAVAEARKWLGVPYYKYGNGRAGINCSQLIAAVYRKIGYNLPFDCDGLYLRLEIIPRDRLQEGDIVLFRPIRGRPKGRLATHAGIYSGGNRVIHAGKKGVVETPLDSFKKMKIIERKDRQEILEWLKEINTI